MKKLNKKEAVAKEPVFYSSIQYLQMSDDTSRLDKMDASEILKEARGYDNGDSIDMDETYAKAVKYPGDTVIAEDDHYAVVNNNQVGGAYDILRKVSEKDIREAINRYGLSNEATDDVKAVAKVMVADDYTNFKASDRYEAYVVAKYLDNEINRK